jgi:hypothetical protein
MLLRPKSAPLVLKILLLTLLLLFQQPDVTSSSAYDDDILTSSEDGPDDEAPVDFDAPATNPQNGMIGWAGRVACALWPSSQPTTRAWHTRSKGSAGAAGMDESKRCCSECVCAIGVA